VKSFGTLVLAFFVSSFVAGIMQNQLAVAFGAREEFITVVMLFVLTAITTTVAFGIALAAAKTVAGVDWTALGMLILTALVLLGFVAAAAIADRKLSISTPDLHILAEIAVPTALMIAIQWWFVRRRWRRANPAAL
jgi:hypothetical protein